MEQNNKKNKNKKSIIKKTKSIIDEFKTKKEATKRALKIKQTKLILKEAYELVNSEEGFNLIFPNKLIKSGFDNSDINMKTIKQHNYYFAMHNGIWESLNLKKKLATLIFMERDFAEKEEREEIIFELNDCLKEYNVEEREGKYYCSLNYDLFKNMNIKECKFNQLSKAQKVNILKNLTQKEIIKIKKTDFRVLQKKNISSYKMAKIIIEAHLMRKVISINKYKTKNNKHKNLEDFLFYVNCENLLSMEDINYNQKAYLKYGQGDLEEFEELVLCLFYSQPIQDIYFKELQNLEDIASLNQHENWGLGIEDKFWKPYKEEIEQYKIFGDLIKHYYPNDKKSDIFFKSMVQYGIIDIDKDGKPTIKDKEEIKKELVKRKINLDKENFNEDTADR